MSENRAYIIAKLVHVSQVDKAGEPYLFHPQRVADAVSHEGLSTAYVQVAWLHDVVEDSVLTVPDLRDLGFSGLVVDAVDAISIRLGESREHYYERVKANEIARTVKLFDIADNADGQRLRRLDEATATRLRAKYAEARAALLDGAS